jgi:hypothetical protein
MRITAFFWILMLLICVACGGAETTQVSAYRVDELRALRDKSLAAAAATYFDGTFTVQEGTQPNQGNANLFHGLLCYSGDAASCSLVQSLECADHALKRAPWRTCDEYSRDELLGHLLVHVSTRTKPVLPSAFPFAMTPEMWFAAWRGGVNDRSLGRLYDEKALLAEAKANPLGYRVHLVAVHLLLRQRSGLWNSAYRNVAKALRDRQPSNPFYRWIYEGGNPTVIDQVLALGAQSSTKQRFWLWQEDDMAKATQAHAVSFVFMTNLLLR